MPIRCRWPAAELPRLRRAFLPSGGLADSRRAGIHVEDQLLHRAALGDSIHPLAEHRHEGGEVIRFTQWVPRIFGALRCRVTAMYTGERQVCCSRTPRLSGECGVIQRISERCVERSDEVSDLRFTVIGPDHADRIEPKRAIPKRWPLGQSRRQPGKPKLFFSINTRFRRRLIVRSRLDLDDNDRAAIGIEYDEVGFIVANPVFAVQDAVPVPAQPAGGESLALVAQGSAASMEER